MSVCFFFFLPCPWFVLSLQAKSNLRLCELLTYIVELWTTQAKPWHVKTGVWTVLCPRTVLTEDGSQTVSFKDGQRMYRVTAESAGTLRIVLHGKARGDVWISEMLQTDEIPREPTMDNVILPQWCRNQMERGAFRFLFLLRIHEHTHTRRKTQHTHTHTHAYSLHTPVQVMRYTGLQGEIHLVYVVKDCDFSHPRIYIYFFDCTKFSLSCKNI